MENFPVVLEAVPLVRFFLAFLVALTVTLEPLVAVPEILLEDVEIALTLRLGPICFVAACAVVVDAGVIAVAGTVAPTVANVTKPVNATINFFIIPDPLIYRRFPAGIYFYNRLVV